MRPKALESRCRGKSPNDLDFWQLHMLAAKALLLLAFFWACLLLPDLRKTDGKKKRWCFAKWQSQYPSNTASLWSHVYQSCTYMASCPAKPVHRAKGSSSGSCALWVTSILSPYSPFPPRYIFQGWLPESLCLSVSCPTLAVLLPPFNSSREYMKPQFYSWVGQLDHLLKNTCQSIYSSSI